MKRKYFALRVIAGVFKVLACLELAVGVIASIYVVVQGAIPPVDLALYPGLHGVTVGLLSLFIGFVLFLGLYAVAEGITVFLDIEENTRHLAERTN
jgi:hypothetical protein